MRYKSYYPLPISLKRVEFLNRTEDESFVYFCAFSVFDVCKRKMLNARGQERGGVGRHDHKKKKKKIARSKFMTPAQTIKYFALSFFDETSSVVFTIFTFSSSCWNGVKYTNVAYCRPKATDIDRRVDSWISQT